MLASLNEELIWFFITVHVLGLACTWAARASEGSRGQTPCQYLFYLCLAVVGTTAIFSMHMATGFWITSGLTLGVMIVGATVTGRRTEQPFAV